MAVDYRCISIPTATRTDQELTRAAQFTRPLTACGRRNRDRSILRPTRPHAQMRKADYARKQVVCALARPTEHPSAPAIRVQKDQASDSASTAATSDTPRKRDSPTAPDRTSLRAIDALDQPNAPTRARMRPNTPHTALHQERFCFIHQGLTPC